MNAREVRARLLAVGVVEVLFDDSRHLIVKPYDRLHLAAEILEVKRCWFHKNHYDIPKRRVAWFVEASRTSSFYRRVRPREIRNVIAEGDAL